MSIKTISDFRSALRSGSYAWPGGYPTYFLTHDGAALCHVCAKSERRYILEAIRDNDVHSGWRICDVDVNWEDNQLFCDHCCERIESAYGEDD